MPYARRLLPLTLATAVLVVAWIVVAAAVAPTDATEGLRQRLTYLHPAFAILTLVAFVAGAFFGWRHLQSDRPLDDLRAYVAIHLGQIYCVIALLTGAIWGKTAWGTFWDWGEPVLVTFLIIFLLYATYQPMRFAIEDPERQARTASVFAVTAGVFAPICFGVVRLTTNLLHPQPLNDPGSNLPGTAGLAFALSVLAIGALFVTLWHLELVHKSTRIRLRKLQRRVEGEDAVPHLARASSPVTL
ncbi:Cytochrome c-type biogenesis protein CcmC putative heme lyase for CcmE [Patulibacter medicamentivorans]|jgi:heme exporter protein C|uniref:Heme exporter protein C n=1 Tax=Patulibacter medicamentivorans TaxID=1097667 RepID=H0EAU2_9ACTN|nr:cytochrome c biogenesis protein CcsA [Patulibacter medicamentivorans]EHN09214.1 Cytochrome c-type biogenesis protein CcmC putative heme lyase for CcmE [Patulibacter medicamentivorans]